ncbi:centrosomal protein of 170 kDa protein B isoform X3 [Oncorhynchus kisutch]|uniref:centrosomal protein of 170 kDa protein B isoform X3 n=1 Tax=Oncorhynchus kisutch TaxID=8019 RepID=UPI0012DF91B1|nr:centrosomal protein of 170 kDa protein B isoform X3 [Oncorhynchus kisutch]
MSNITEITEGSRLLSTKVSYFGMVNEMSRSVDKQHAVINYNPATDEHLVKDLGSLNGTFVNDLRIPDQIYITLKLSDVIRFGYDSHVYVLEKSQHKVPEEALKHEKYTSQLQMGLRASEGKRAEHLDDRSKLEKTDRKSLSQETPTSRPTPLYGQPSWWGEEDAASKRQHSEGHRSEEGHPEIPKEGSALDSEVNGSLLEYRDAQGKSSFSYHREPSYFEIPTKEFQLHPKSPGAELHEIPTKDTDTPHAPSIPTTSPTPPVVQSHASFTIEFDDCTPGKIKIKDHVTKFSSRQRKQQQVSGKTLATTPTEEMSAECKVADWLVHSDVRMMRRRPTCEDVYSVKSDQAVNIKSLKGHQHDDGTQSDSEDPVLGKGKQSKSHHRIQSQHSIQSELSQSELSEPSQQTVRSYQLVPSQQTVQSHHSIQSDQSVPSQQTVLSVQPHQTVQSVPSQMLLQPQFSPPKQTPVSPVVPERPLSESPPEVRSPTMGPSKPDPQEPLSQQAFIIEFFDNPRKKRSQSFTANPAHADSYSTLKAKLERRKGGERPNSMHGHIPPTQQVTVPLKGQGQGHGGSLRSSSLKREKTEEPLSGVSASSSSGSGPSSRASSGITIKLFGSVGKKSKLAQEFAAEILMKDAAHRALSPTRDKTSPPMSAPPVMMMSPSRTRIPSPLDPPSSLSYPSTPLQTTAPRSYSPTPAPHSPALALSQPPSRSPVQTASPVRSAVPSTTPPMPLDLGVCGVDPKASRVVRNEEEDSLSDAGTYTIETESQDKEVEEARNMIDQVFGVLDSPEYSGAGVYRPIINDGKDEPAMLRPSDASTVDQMKAVSMHGFNPAALSGAPSGPFQFPTRFQVPSSNTAAQEEGPKWVSRWASLADSCAEPGCTPPQGEFAEGDLRLSRLMPSHSVDNSESEGSQSCRIRRLLPQVPPGDGDKPESPTPSILIRHEPPYPGPETPLERSSGTPRHQDSTQRLCIQDDVDPDSLSDASRSDDGSVLERTRKSQGRTSGATSPGDAGPQYRGQDKLSPTQPTKSTSFYIGSEECSLGKPDLARSPFLSQGPDRGRDTPAKTFPTTVLIRHLSSHEPRRLGIKPNNSAPNLHSQQDKESKDPSKDSLGTSSFVRQESFTKEQPSDNIQIKRLPHISSHPTLRDMEQRRETAKDPQPFLREAADASLSSLEAKLPSSGSGHSSKRGGSSSHMDDSLSGESDVDTASTVSLVSNKNTHITTGPKKRTAARSSSSPSVQEKGHRQPTARERLSEKRRSHVAASDNSSSKAEQAKRFQMRRSTGNCGSLELSEDQQSSGQHWPDTASDHETGSRPASRNKKLIAPLQKEDNGKTPKSAAQQALIRSNSLSAPRPTRASMLRRARLGETSDNDGTETDRGSQNSDHIIAPSKVSADGKKLLSRLDILAMPRKRAGSFTTPSDNESSITTPSTRPGFSNRIAESTGPVRKTSVGEAGAKQGVTRGSVAPGKQPLTRTRSSGTKYSSTTSSRQRQKGSDYTSTSEEEYEASSGTPKHKRSSHMSAATQTPRAQKEKAAAEVARSKSGSLELEEDEVQNEDDHYQNWTTHSAEIAKLSQDLAKDLAILAREIHDVAGDGDSQSSSGMGTNPSPSSAPNTPGPASTIPISSREERPCTSLRGVLPSQLVQHIPEASLNYQKVLLSPGSTAVMDLDPNMNDQDPSSKPRWNREEVILDNLMLNPVSQLSQAIRENTEQLAEKMKVLFHNKTEAWEEIEAKINAENEVPILKTSNKEISSILNELRRVQKQLEMINSIVEPGGAGSGNPKVAAVATAASGGQATRSPSRQKKSPSKPTGPGDRQRGAGPSTSPTTSKPNANESTKRTTRGPKGANFMA